MTQRQLEQAGFVFIALSLGLVQLKLQLGQGVFFTLASLTWLVLIIRDGHAWDAIKPGRGTPSFFFPLLLYAAWTLASSAMSGNPQASFIDSKQLLMFLMVPVVARFCAGDRATRTVDVIIAIGSAGALWGIVQFAMLGYTDLDHRPRGLLNHWMTYSGVLMLVFCAAVARMIFRPARVAWPMIAVPALLVALVVTNTRNAWIGTFLAVLVLVAIRNWKLLLVAPAVAIIAVVLAPGLVQERVRSIVNPNDLGSRDRIVMWKIGRDMIRDYPVFGAGPEQIQVKYESYRQAYPEAVNARNPHLHNVPIQIAAERGLPALVLWLWFVVMAARDLWRQLRARIAPDVAAAGLAALVAMLAAGMFEYNFGDSEFLMLFLGILTLPFAAAKVRR
ncbi:MAG TPA: O-antigen ligase family protein [Vicinamibacterales bacterium]|nr:O-antigen ligase family protein [Vicinamibacterales bacterium]